MSGTSSIIILLMLKRQNYKLIEIDRELDLFKFDIRYKYGD